MTSRFGNAAPGRAGRRPVRGFTAAATIAALLATAGSASAADPTGDYADFKHCPLADATVQSCLYSTTTSGSFQLGNATVPINKTITLQGGFKRDATSPTGFTFINAVGADTLSKTPLDVPGGLLGITVPEQIRAIPFLGPIFDAAVNAVNGVKATAELVGPIGFNFTNYLTKRNTTVSLPVRVKLDNPFLGSSCYIGSASNPITMNLTTGTTAPPAPNTPITGTPGTVTLSNAGQLTTAVNNKLVDNSLAAPAASDCGPWGFRWAVTPIVNLKEGLPSAAGNNSAILQGNLKSGAAQAVRNSIPQ